MGGTGLRTPGMGSRAELSPAPRPHLRDTQSLMVHVASRAISGPSGHPPGLAVCNRGRATRLDRGVSAVSSRGLGVSLSPLDEPRAAHPVYESRPTWVSLPL